MTGCELVVADLVGSVSFYETWLDFRVDRGTDDHVVLISPFDELSLVARSSLPDDHYFDRRAFSSQRVGVGVEIVLERPNWRDLYERAAQASLSYLEAPQTQPWGLTDFRLADPDGYYLRVTEPRSMRTVPGTKWCLALFQRLAAAVEGDR